MQVARVHPPPQPPTSSTRAPPVPPVSCVGGLGGGGGGPQPAWMTPVTEPLWVLERLPGEPGAPLRLLLITPDWVKACRSQTLSRRTGKLHLTRRVAGLLGIAPSRPAVQSLHWFHVYAHVHIFVHVHPPSYRARTAGGTVLLLPVAGDLQTRSQGISNATCRAFSHFSFFCCSVFFFPNTPPPFNFPH